MVNSVIYLLFSYQTGYIMWHSRLMMYIPFGCALGNIDPKPGMSHYIPCLDVESFQGSTFCLFVMVQPWNIGVCWIDQVFVTELTVVIFFAVIYLLFSYQTWYIMWHSRLRIYIPFGCASGNIDPKPGMSHYIPCLIAE
jgi:hypothetical protein